MPDVVKCVSRHVEDLADGRVLAPGETASGVDLKDLHNKRLVDEGRLAVVEGSKKKTGQQEPENPEQGGNS